MNLVEISRCRTAGVPICTMRRCPSETDTAQRFTFMKDSLGCSSLNQARGKQSNSTSLRNHLSVRPALPRLKRLICITLLLPTCVLIRLRRLVLLLLGNLIFQLPSFKMHTEITWLIMNFQSKRWQKI